MRLTKSAEITIFILFNLIILTEEYYIPLGDHQNLTLSSFAFGSCFYGRESTRFDMFNTISKHKPDVWLWLGDASYVDKEGVHLTYFKSSIDVNFTLAEEIFNKGKDNLCKIIFIKLDYKQFRKNIPTIGVWDDHDYALNDGNGYFKHKEKAKKIYLDFIDEPEDSPRRTPDLTINATYSFGNKTTHKTVRMILLDVRYNKSWLWDKDADILGEQQWHWLEEVLVNNDETFTFIASGTQILPYNRFMSEAWYGFARKRLFDLLGKTKKKGVILLTGDIHAAELLKTYCVLPEVGYYLYEICSSGLSHYDHDGFMMNALLPTDYHIIPTMSYYNFAKLEFDWGFSKIDSKVRVTIVDIDDVTRSAMTIAYKDLIYDSNKIKDPDCYNKLTSRFKSFKQLYELYSRDIWDWVNLWPWLMLFHFIYLLSKMLIFIVKLICKIMYRKKNL